MVVICPTCREVVHLSDGVIIEHGSRDHGKTHLCMSSGTIYHLDVESYS